MRSLIAICVLLAATACTTAPCGHCERDRAAVVYTFVDTDDDGLPDTRVQQGLIDLPTRVVIHTDANGQPDPRAPAGFGFTSLGQATFVDSDDDGLPDTRLPSFQPDTTRDERIEGALLELEQAIAALRRELQQR